jgi:STE24 endopeptidase
MSAVAIVLALVIALHFLADLWLEQRQVRHVHAHRDSVPTAFADRVTLADHHKAADYTVAHLQFDRWQNLAQLALLVILVFGGGFAALQSAVADIAGTGPLGALALACALAAIFTLLSLPFTYYSTFSLEARFGFNKTTRSLFAIDQIKGLLIGLAFLAPIVFGIDFAMRALGPDWWILGWGLWVAFNLIAILIVPTLIMPLFNRFEPLAEGDLRARIEGLLARCGLGSKGVFTMDGSKRSSHGNAFFTGLGPSKRIVLFDTLMTQLSSDEIEAVLAHEIGHFKRRHIVKRIILSFAISLMVFALMGYLSQQPWFYAAFGVDPALATHFPFVAILMFVLVFPSFAYWFRAAGNQMSRRHEFEADGYAAVQARPGDLATALVKLYRDNASTLTPDPLYSWVNHSHPTAAQRIARLTGPSGKPS